MALLLFILLSRIQQASERFGISAWLIAMYACALKADLAELALNASLSDVVSARMQLELGAHAFRGVEPVDNNDPLWPYSHRDLVAEVVGRAYDLAVS